MNEKKSTLKSVWEWVQTAGTALIVWIIFVHGILVFLPTALGGLAIYGLHFVSALELGLFTTLLSLGISTPALLGLTPRFDGAAFIVYLLVGWLVGAIAVLGSTAWFFLYRLGRLIVNLSQPTMPAVETYALGIAALAGTVAFVAAIKVLADEKAEQRARATQ